MKFSIHTAVISAVAASFLAVSPAFAGPVNGSHAAIQCDTCHAKQAKPQAPAQKTCLQCHGSYDALAKKSAAKDAKYNPHDSHAGRLECTTCHSMHKKSHFVCRDCHAIADRKFKGE